MDDMKESLTETVARSDSTAADPLIGTTVSRFRIETRLGAGGMGVVYRAIDTRLERRVALKFLAPELTRNEEARRRFVNEARAASALDHPNICIVHDVDETADGRTFIAMACYDGETLAAKVARGQLPAEEALRYATQVAAALQAAHARGIVHRDLKPANVLVTEAGQVKLLDFGLAKLVDVTQTQVGTRLGTALYMSPEQARGDEVDHRSDLFSLGVLLYEMLTGERPFRGDSEAAVTYSIVHAEPARLTVIAPAPLRSLLTRLLEKEAARRPADAAEVARELNALAERRAEAAPETSSIVVLPFVNMNRDPDQEYFADGLTEEILSDLASIRSLRVISRTSSMAYKGTTKDLPTIAVELNVQYVLEGSVRRAGDRLRITAQLIDARRDAHLWAEKFDGRSADVFEMQETVARKVLESLQAELSPQEKKRLGTSPIQEPEAWDCYLRAKHEVWIGTPEAMDRAQKYLEAASQLAGKSALLTASLAYVHFHKANFGYAQEESIEQAERLAREALALDDSCFQALIVLGASGASFRGEFSESVRMLERARELVPSESDALIWLAVTYIVKGCNEKALAATESLLRIDPRAAATHLARSFVLLRAGRLEESVEPARTTCRLAPDAPHAYYMMAMVLAHLGDRAGLLELEHTDLSSCQSRLGFLYQRVGSGNTTGMREAIDDELRRTCWRDPDYSVSIAALLSAAGLADDAIRWLENAVSRGFANDGYLERHDPFLAPLRGDPRFRALIGRIRAMCGDDRENRDSAPD